MVPERLETEFKDLCRENAFELLDLTLSGTKGRQSLRVIIDRRTEFISIDECVDLARQVRHLVAEKRLINGDYRLEVSSPGLDYPLREMWQFKKNIGRLLKITVQSERGPKEISGRLAGADSSGITLVVENMEMTPKYEELLSAKVLPEI